MNLTGISIAVNDEKKFVGKVGRVPVNAVLPSWAGRVAFYREVPYSQVYSYVTGSIGVDQAAWEKAVELGAEGMIVFCPDTHGIYIASRSLMDNSGVVDLGEYPQVRIPVSKIEHIPEGESLPFGWTKNVLLVGATRRPVNRVEAADVSSVQLGLF